MDLLGTVEDNRSTLSARASGSVQSLDHSLRSFCAFFLLVFALFMTTQSNLVWNVRYLIPALPMIYLLVASSVPSFEIGFATMGLGRIVRGAGTVERVRQRLGVASLCLPFVATGLIPCIYRRAAFPHRATPIELPLRERTSKATLAN